MISKIEIDLFKEEHVGESVYLAKRAEFIASYKHYHDMEYKNNPVMGEAEWNRQYPSGYRDWKGKQRSLNAYGQQEVINKINEIADKVNAIEERYFL